MRNIKEILFSKSKYLTKLTSVFLYSSIEIQLIK